MPRIRTIKPSFFKNEVLPDIPFEGRLLFIGLWTLADKEGRLEDRPRRIKSDIFPYEDVDVDRLLNTLDKFLFIHRYETEFQVKLIQIITFQKHQRITGKEATTPSEFPAPNLPERYGKHRGNIGETSGKHRGTEGEIDFNIKNNLEKGVGEKKQIEDNFNLDETLAGGLVLDGKHRGNIGETIETTGKERKGNNNINTKSIGNKDLSKNIKQKNNRNSEEKTNEKKDYYENNWHLPIEIENCLPYFLNHAAFTDNRAVAAKRLHQDLNFPPHEVLIQELEEWGNRFNSFLSQSQIKKKTMGGSEGWALHFTNWLNKQLSNQQNNLKKNGTHRQAPTGTIIPKDKQFGKL